jgi:hypothetical protein
MKTMLIHNKRERDNFCVYIKLTSIQDSAVGWGGGGGEGAPWYLSGGDKAGLETEYRDHVPVETEGFKLLANLDFRQKLKYL